MMLEDGRRPEAIQTASGTLAFVTGNHYRRYELAARSIIGRAQQDLGNYDGAVATARSVLGVAEAIHDEARQPRP